MRYGKKERTIGVGNGTYHLGIHGEGTVNTNTTTLASPLLERVRSFLESTRFERSITAPIVANAITLGIETSPPVAARFGDSLYAFDRLVLAVFVVELLLRFFVYRRRFFRDPWRVFGGRQCDAVPGNRRYKGRGRSAHPVDPRRGSRVAAGNRGAAGVVEGCEVHPDHKAATDIAVNAVF